MSKFTLTLDSSQIYDFQTCPLKWYYRYRENLVLNEARNEAPDKGTLVHKLLDYYYTLISLNRSTPKLELASKAIELYSADPISKKLFPNDYQAINKFICDRFLLYVQRWITDDFNVIDNGIELGFSYLLHEDESTRFILEGRIDLMNEIQGKLCFTDHKTQARTTDLYHYRPQFKTYALVTGAEYGIINYFGMQEDKTNELLKKNKLFRRDLIHFDKWMIDEWKEKLIYTFYEIKTMLDIGSNFHMFYNMRNDSACAGPFDSNPCQFTHICETHETMKEQVKSFKYTIGEPWSPWKLDELKDAK